MGLQESSHLPQQHGRRPLQFVKSNLILNFLLFNFNLNIEQGNFVPRTETVRRVDSGVQIGDSLPSTNGDGSFEFGIGIGTCRFERRGH